MGRLWQLPPSCSFRGDARVCRWLPTHAKLPFTLLRSGWVSSPCCTRPWLHAAGAPLLPHATPPQVAHVPDAASCAASAVPPTDGCSTQSVRAGCDAAAHAEPPGAAGLPCLPGGLMAARLALPQTEAGMLHCTAQAPSQPRQRRRRQQPAHAQTATKTQLT